MSQDVMDIVLKVDYHCHTYHSPCGQAEMVPEVVIRTAEERGIEVLGFTDHFYRHLLHKDYFRQVREECAGKNGNIRLYFGCEADVVSPNAIAITEEESKQFDYVLASVHYQNVGIVEQPANGDSEVVASHFLAMFCRAASTRYVDIIPHPFFMGLNTYDPKAAELLTDKEIMGGIEMAKENGIAIEISPRALFPEQTPFMLRFYGLCKKAGLKFSVGSDAHRLSAIGINSQLEPIIRHLELKPDDLWKPAL